MNHPKQLFDLLIAGGEVAIDDLIQMRKSEELFLDFKRSANQGNSRHLDSKDNNNFAKAISGFGNSEGGVIVWGVDCSRDSSGADVASCKYPLSDAAAFVSRLEGAVSRCTVPAHSRVRSHAILCSDGISGFAVSLIPKSLNAPHQTIPELKYFMRAGSDFMPVPHSVLSGMFGRRPEPNLGALYIMEHPTIVGSEIQFDVGIALRNEGPGIARDIFLTLMGKSVPGQVGCLAFESVDPDNWIVTKTLGAHMSYLTKPDIRLAPDCQLMPVSLKFRISSPITQHLKIEGQLGCEGGMPYHFSFENSADEMRALYEATMQAHTTSQLSEERLSHFSKSFIKPDSASIED